MQSFVENNQSSFARVKYPTKTLRLPATQSLLALQGSAVETLKLDVFDPV